MTTWRALAWDDEAREGDAEHILSKLKEKLANSMGISITSTVEECYRQFTDDGPWDLLILDMIDKKSDPEHADSLAGPKLATSIRALQKDIPVVFLTHDDGMVIRNQIAIGGAVLFRSKSNPAGSLANDIRDFMRQESFSKTKVFLIWGHGSKAPGFKEKVVNRLADRGLEVIEISPEDVMSSLTQGLVERMHDCGAFVAICTPDDKTDDWYQPRQNVLLEIGMAAGLRRGFERLVILQRWGQKAEVQAKLPSDLGGILTIRFFEEHEDALEKLVKALKLRGMQVSPG